MTGEDDCWVTDVPWVVGLVFTVASGAVIIGGIRSIARVTEKLVPLMAAVHMISAVVVFAANLELVPAAFAASFEGAFPSTAPPVGSWAR